MTRKQAEKILNAIEIVANDEYFNTDIENKIAVIGLLADVLDENVNNLKTTED